MSRKRQRRLGLQGLRTKAYANPTVGSGSSEDFAPPPPGKCVKFDVQNFFVRLGYIMVDVYSCSRGGLRNNF